MKTHKEEFLWVEKYRPSTIQECILPKKIKAELQTQIDNKNIQHLLFHGIQGSGKTTAAFAIANELKADTMVINASDERGVDLFRMKVKQFISSVSLTGQTKIVLLEEADQLTPEAQGILRRMTEEFSKNSKFILTCNYPVKIIDALHSRLASYSFNTTSKEKNSLGNQFFKRVKMILDENKINYEDPILVKFILKHFPDYRKILNELQKYSLNGKIDAGIFAISSMDLDEYIGYLLEKDFKLARKYIAENNLEASFYGQLYNKILNCGKFPSSSLPDIILIIANYQYKHSFVVDTHVNIAAMSIEIMASLN